MLLCELENKLDGHSKVVFDLLWDMVNGKVPKIDFLTMEESRKVFVGIDVDGVKSPFTRLSKSMTVRRLPLMSLCTTKSMRMRQRQMAVSRVFDTVNKMLDILAFEAESIELSQVSY